MKGNSLFLGKPLKHIEILVYIKNDFYIQHPSVIVVLHHWYFFGVATRLLVEIFFLK